LRFCRIALKYKTSWIFCILKNFETADRFSHAAVRPT
jgi:hypothetical protein